MSVSVSVQEAPYLHPQPAGQPGPINQVQKCQHTQCKGCSPHPQGSLTTVCHFQNEGPQRRPMSSAGAPRPSSQQQPKPYAWSQEWAWNEVCNVPPVDVCLLQYLPQLCQFNFARVS